LHRPTCACCTRALRFWRSPASELSGKMGKAQQSHTLCHTAECNEEGAPMLWYASVVPGAGTSRALTRPGADHETDRDSGDPSSLRSVGMTRWWNVRRPLTVCLLDECNEERSSYLQSCRGGTRGRYLACANPPRRRPRDRPGLGRSLVAPLRRDDTMARRSQTKKAGPGRSRVPLGVCSRSSARSAVSARLGEDVSGREWRVACR